MHSVPESTRLKMAMQQLLLVGLCVMAVSCIPLYIEDSDREQQQQIYYREKRQAIPPLKLEIATQPPVKLSYNENLNPREGFQNLGAQKTLFDNGKTKLDASAGFARAWNPSGKFEQGQVRLDAQQKLFENDRTQIALQGGAQRNFGVGPAHQFDIGATAKQNLWRSKDRTGSLDLTGQVNRQFGMGPPRNNWGTGVTFTKTW